MKWMIEVDRLDPSRFNQRATLEQKVAMPHRFELYDDDAVLYFEGRSSDDSSLEAFQPLDWAMSDSGCTEIRYLNPKTRKWETL